LQARSLILNEFAPKVAADVSDVLVGLREPVDAFCVTSALKPIGEYLRRILINGTRTFDQIRGCGVDAFTSYFWLGRELGQA